MRDGSARSGDSGMICGSGTTAGEEREKVLAVRAGGRIESNVGVSSGRSSIGISLAREARDNRVAGVISGAEVSGEGVLTALTIPEALLAGRDDGPFVSVASCRATAADNAFGGSFVVRTGRERAGGFAREGVTGIAGVIRDGPGE